MMQSKLTESSQSDTANSADDKPTITIESSQSDTANSADDAKMTQSKLIAIAGGIASGKSVVIAQLRSLGANVLSADDINRQLLSTPEYLNKVLRAFPSCDSGGVLDKVRLRELISRDDSARTTLNGMAHPCIQGEIIRRAAAIGGVVFVEIPLLKSSNMGGIFSEVWYVRTPLDRRVKLLTKRDNITEAAARAIIGVQYEEKQLELTADCIIDNDNTYTQLCEKVAELFFKTLR